MKKIEMPNFKAKNNKEYSFETTTELSSTETSMYYEIKVKNELGEQVGKMILENQIKKLFEEKYKSQKGLLKFIEDQNITDTGLIIEPELKVVDRGLFKEFTQDFLGLDRVNLRNEEEKEDFFMELKAFLKPEMETVLNTVGKPQITTVFIKDGTKAKEEDLRGLGIGKMLYTYATQWMGENNMKVYTQDIRTPDAKKIWEMFKSNPEFNYEKDSLGNESIFRNDGLKPEIKNKTKVKLR